MKPPRRPGCNGPCCLRPASEGSSSGDAFSRPFLRSLPLRPDGSLTILNDGFVNRLQSFGFPTLRYPSYEAPGYYLGGPFLPLNTPAFHWTCTGTRCFSSSNQLRTRLILLGESDSTSPVFVPSSFIIKKRLPSGWMSQGVPSPIEKPTYLL